MTTQDKEQRGEPIGKTAKAKQPRAKSSSGKRPIESSSSRDQISATIEPETLIGDYIIVKKLDEGGMGSVYEGVHPVIGKRVAIKVLHPHVARQEVSVARFIQEARAVNAIGHPEIVDVFGFGKFTDGRQYIVMEFLEGCHLLSYLNENGTLDPLKACYLVRKIAGALEAAHEKGVIHRDLKPENVFLLTTKNNAWPPGMKLLDFGLAKLVEGKFSKGPQTRMGATVGTPYYMAPEQCRGRVVDPRTDIYALGIMFYEMITGRVPFFAEHSVDVLYMHLTQDPDPPSMWADVPKEIESLIMACMSKPPELRPATMNAVIAEIENIERKLVEGESRDTSSFTDLLATTADLLGKAQKEVFRKEQRIGESIADFSSKPVSPGEESFDEKGSFSENVADADIKEKDSDEVGGESKETDFSLEKEVQEEPDPEAGMASPSSNREHRAKVGGKEKTEKISLRASSKTARAEDGTKAFSTRDFILGVMLGIAVGVAAGVFLTMMF